MAVRFDRIDALRNERDMTEKELLQATQQSPNNFTRWRKGEATPSYASILRIANYFNVDVRYLLDQVDSPYGEMNFENIKNMMLDCEMDVEQTYSNSVGEQWMVAYNRGTIYFPDADFKKICANLNKKINISSKEIIEKWRDKVFGSSNQNIIHQTLEPLDKQLFTEDEVKLIQQYRNLDDEGKIMLKSTMISELRRIK